MLTGDYLKKEENAHPYRAVPYFILFIPLLISPFLDKSVYSMSLMLPWALALFVYPLFLLLKRWALGYQSNMFEYGWLALLPVLLFLVLAGVEFQMTYALIAIFGLAIATADSYPAYLESRKPGRS